MIRNDNNSFVQTAGMLFSRLPVAPNIQAPLMHRAYTVTVMLPTAAFLIGLFLGWLLTTTFAVAAISRSQERMQRKVRYWQAQTTRARTEAERLARLMEAHGVRPTPASWEELP